MRIALFSDLHSNLPAIESCLADAKSRGFDQVAILGDIVGYGPHPAELVDLCISLQSEGAIVLKGNHDEFQDLTRDNGQPLPANDQFIAAAWTSQVLNDGQRKWLSELPFTHTLNSVHLVHATADAPEAWHYSSDPHRAERSLQAACANPAVRYVFCGHVHHQTLFYAGTTKTLMPFTPRPGVPIPVGTHRRWLASVGSVGQPRDGDPRANYAIMDTDRNLLTFYRVAYDVRATVDAIVAAGLPEGLAQRLEQGE